VINSKIADNAVDSKKIKDGAVKSTDIGDGQVTASKLGADVKLGEVYTRTAEKTVVKPGPYFHNFGTVAYCDTGDVLTGGGFNRSPRSAALDSVHDDFVIDKNGPVVDSQTGQNGWGAYGSFPPDKMKITVYALCLKGR
jgi:hypothetical protein